MTVLLTAAEARVIARDMIITLSGVAASSVLLADGRGAAPTAPAITYRWVADAPVGLGAQVWHTPAPTMLDPMPAPEPRQASARSVSVLLEAFGLSAIAALEALVILLDSDDPRRVAIVTRGVCVRRVGPVQDRTAMLADAPEPRADCAVVLGYVRGPARQVAGLADGIAIDIDGDSAAYDTIPLT